MMATLTRADGTAIRLRREQLGLTVDQVADAAKCHPDHLRNIELGRRNPSPPLLVQIARALGVDRDTLVAKATPEQETASGGGR